MERTWHIARRAAHPLALLTFAAVGAADIGGTWIELEPMQIARQEVGAARIGERVYVVGGLVLPFPPLTATDTVEVYDIGTGDWSFAAPMPFPLDHMAVAAHGGRLYVFGGFSADFSARDETWIYDPGTDSWTAGALLPERRGACWAVTVEARIYLFGGVDASDVARRETFIYDPAMDAWSQGANMPTAREHLNAVALDGFVYVLGGRGGGASAANERYEPATDSWAVLAPMPTARSAMAAAAFRGRIFAMGGEVPVLRNVNEVYDPALNSWSCQAVMPLPRHGVAAVALEDRILLPGGGTIQGLQPTERVDSFVPADFEPFCFCSSGAPCGNEDSSGGCTNSTGAGARILATGSASVALNDLRVDADALPANQPALLFVGEQAVNGGAGLPFGDGLRCAGTNVKRLGIQTADGLGRAAWGPRLGRLAGWQPGDIRRLQVWYRDPNGGPCASGFNLTHGIEARFAP